MYYANLLRISMIIIYIDELNYNNAKIVGIEIVLYINNNIYLDHNEKNHQKYFLI